MDKINQLLDIYNNYPFKIKPNIIPKYFKSIYNNKESDSLLLSKLQENMPNECEICHNNSILKFFYILEYSILDRKCNISSIKVFLYLKK